MNNIRIGKSGLLIFESFIEWGLNENISAAKSYMQKKYASIHRKTVSELTPEEKDKALKDEAFLEIMALLKNHPGYVFPFVKFHFDQKVPISSNSDTDEIISLSQLIDVITNKKYIIQQLSKPIEKWATIESENGISGFEQLTDEIRTIEREKEAKWFVNALPKGLRDKYRELDSEDKKRIITLAVQLNDLGKSAIDRLFEKIKAMESWKIKDVIEYISNYVDGFSNLKMKEKISELESLQPEAGILYSDDKYLVMSIRTESAQKKLCAVANWCINRGRFNSYADKGVQINIFNFDADPSSLLFLTGTTISFGGVVTDSHDIEDHNIKTRSDVAEHFTSLGYPKSLVNAVVRELPDEYAIKKALTEINKEGLSKKTVIGSLLTISKGALAGKISEHAWDQVAGEVSRIIMEREKFTKSDFMKLFIEIGIFEDYQWKVFDEIMKNDYTQKELDEIMESTLEKIEDMKFLLDNYKSGDDDIMRSIVDKEDKIISQFEKRKK